MCDGARHYFAGVALVDATAAAFFVAFTLAVDFACFAFLVLLTVDVLLAVVLVAAAFGAGAGVACAANETPAIANVMVRPMIAEAVFVIFLSVLFSEALILFASVY